MRNSLIQLSVHFLRLISFNHKLNLLRLLVSADLVGKVGGCRSRQR